ncbi:MAG: histidine ammonia-lyase [Gammaproteobacteria bacterium]|nr:histidine ammonia-lyase [Gammaproteobacteria bacterium]MYI77932.1 histidine ammonia-lyase [Gammaproteobacteria bacterium]
MTLLVGDTSATLRQLRSAWQSPVSVELTHGALQRVENSYQYLKEYLASGATAYGINTGFGKFATKPIEINQLELLQKNLIRSHAVGVGPPLTNDVVRVCMVLKIIALARGYSGVRVQLIELLCAMVEHEIYPVMPSQGSVGASGDLAPLAHMSSALIGEGNVSHDNEIKSAAEALASAGLTPIRFGPKAGLALLNGTQVSTALCLTALFRFENVLSATILAGVMSTDAVQGSDTPFDSRIHEIRGHSSQLEASKLLTEMMRGSEIRAAHLDCNRVQDPYSIRCQPQILGACINTMRHVAGVLEIESNAVTDNPLIFAKDEAILSGGNFHAEPVALVADNLALAISEIGSISERRVALMMDPPLSGLPPFLVSEGGLNSGFMMAQVTAAALASENKSRAHPASVDSIPTSANQEDHVSMATFAAQRLHKMLDNAEYIVAIEMIAAMQGIELRRPLKSSEKIETTIESLREFSPRYTTDRSLAPEIETVAKKIKDGAFNDVASAILPSLKA